MIDFLFDNPFLVVILLFWVLNALFGKKKPKAVQEKRGHVAEPAKQSLKERFREEMERFEREAGMNAGSGSTVSVTHIEQVPSPVGVNVVSSTSYSGGAVQQEEQFAWDDSDDGSIREKDASGDVFAYRSAIQEPTERQYHLSGFRDFHLAGGLTEEDRTLLAENGLGDSDGPAPAAAIARFLSERSEIRRAMLLQEVLGRPKALCPPAFRGFGRV